MLVLVGWGLDVPNLKSVVPGLATMKPFTALALLLASCSLYLLSDPSTTPERRRIARLLALGTASMGGAMLLEWVFGLSLGIDDLIFRSGVHGETIQYPGRMSAATATGCLCLGLALLTVKRSTGVVPQLFCGVAVILSFLGLVGYVLDVSALYSTTPFATMALHTATIICILSVLTLLLDRTTGISRVFFSMQAGGWFARKAIPFVILVPLAFGSARLWGERHGYYGTEFGVALYCTSLVFTLVAVVLFSANALNKLHQHKDEADSLGYFLSALVNSSNDAIIGKDLSGRITSWNKGAEQIFGYCADEMVGGTIDHLIADEGRAKNADALQQARKGCAVPSFACLVTRRDGCQIHVSLTISSVLDDHGAVRGISTIARDVTRQVETERALRSAQLRLNGIIDSAMDAIITIEDDQQVIMFNKAAETMFQCSAETALGASLDRFIPERFRDDHRQHVRNFGNSGEKSRKMGSLDSVWGLRGSTAEFPLEASISQVAVDGARLYTVILRDISDRKRVEEIVSQSQKMQALGNLAGGVAHDINNLLAAVMGNTQLATVRLPREHEVQKLLSQVDLACTRAAGIVRQILTFSRKSDSEMVPTRVPSVVEEGITLLRAAVPKSVAIHTSFSPDTPQILIDPVQLLQVAMNLGMNAVHAIGDRADGAISIETARVVVEGTNSSTALESGVYSRIRISDNGCGMNAETLKHIFDPFFTTKAPGEGTGLGMSVVHGIVHASGGRVFVTSQLGTGTAIDLYFPAIAAEPTTDRVFDLNFATANQQKRILYIDDEVELARVIKSLLEALGYDVTTCTDPHEALAILRRPGSAFDGVITDLAMPGVSGLDVVRLIREFNPSIPVAFISGLIRTEDRQRAEQMGVRVMIQKPAPLPELAKSVHDLMSVDIIH